MSDIPTLSLTLPICLWIRLLRQLRRRGDGCRETGAFLLGRRLPRKAHITAFLCYDDLDPQACQSGAITFHAPGYSGLWDHCRTRGLQVVADVHTHPGSHVGQSHVDQQHPMLPIPGHIAMIVPRFGHMAWWSLRSLGVYEYLGNFRWHSHSRSRPHSVRLTLW